MRSRSPHKPLSAPQRGEVWQVNFNSPMIAHPERSSGAPRQLPTTGGEIYKVRPALVLNIAADWEIALHIVVPFRSWKNWFDQNGLFWIVHIERNERNGLSRDSGADTFQVKSLARERFVRRLGALAPDQVEFIAKVVALNIGLAHVDRAPRKN